MQSLLHGVTQPGHLYNPSFFPYNLATKIHHANRTKYLSSAKADILTTKTPPPRIKHNRSPECIPPPSSPSSSPPWLRQPFSPLQPKQVIITTLALSATTSLTPLMSHMKLTTPSQRTPNIMRLALTTTSQQALTLLTCFKKADKVAFGYGFYPAGFP